MTRQKGGDLTQSYDKSPYTNRKRKRKRSDSVPWQKPLHQQKCQKGNVTKQTTPQKSSIKQRLRTDLGRSVGVTNSHPTGVVNLVYGRPTFPLPTTAVKSKCQRGKVTTQTTPQKSSNKQKLRTDLGRSVGVTSATQLVWLTGLRAHLPTQRNSRLIKRTHI